MTTLPEGESNPGPLAWGADALPTELSLQLPKWGRKGYCFGGYLYI